MSKQFTSWLNYAIHLYPQSFVLVEISWLEPDEPRCVDAHKIMFYYVVSLVVTVKDLQ